MSRIVRAGFGLLLSLDAASANVQIPTQEIAAGVNMPVVLIGTGGLEHDQATEIVTNWMHAGGRGVDTAVMYRDQDVVAKAINASGVSRKDVFITTKIPGCYDAEKMVEFCLSQLGTDYVDLLLIHTPTCPVYYPNCSALEKEWNCTATWETLEKYHSRGILRAIGVSNFEKQHLEPLLRTATVVPAVNQIQLNVLRHDDDTIEFSRAHNITIEAYSPLGRSNHSGDITGNPSMRAIAAAHNVTTYQVAMKWVLQHGHVVTFQSTSEAHQQVDADLFGFNLTDREMGDLDALQSSGTQIMI